MFNNISFLDIMNYLDYFAQNISSVYKRNFIKNILTETYNPLNITVDMIKNSILTVNYEIKQINNSKNYEIIKLLNDEFQYIHVKFIENNTYKGAYKYQNSGIIYAETDTFENIEIYVSEIFINKIKALRKEDLNTLTEDLIKIYNHEYTHKQQIHSQKVDIEGFDVSTINNVIKTKEYLSHIREIDAHARETAAELLLTGKSVKDLKDLIKNNKEDTLVTISRVFRMYWSAFNKFNKYPLKNDLSVFKNYKKKIIEFLDQDKDVLNKNSLIYLLKNKSDV